MKTIIVIPTYNEKENILKLIPLVKKAVKGVHILVVDDASPDKTGAAVAAIAKKDRAIKLISRSGKLGLGTAYVEGFKYALKHGYDYIFEMDADFSHDPQYLKNFLEEIKENDLVIGSRYINGISVVNWPIRRLMLSKFAGFYARTITGLPLTDCTSGFKCFKRNVLESINLDKIHSDGYAFQIEMHYKAWKKGFKIKETPIIFVDRHSGSSKMSHGVMMEAAVIVWKLRLGII
ncbi:MAG TPA: polyprenol monophosphomannose synthase [Candidatus Goldiibacteriota bacterium]|jgi:dolichol-phosphate mannosyltransferase|nr:polyprenol monophosphomannose synthase [Candidatus Goldiibacteriota bacterium]HPN65026.1 polyprenol monophosphomannose synthase [Candidatus Goldiibacteriota bacterium]HRQ44351.1 polyprenol monophosphomannose synthase [Candidatus Goldiibacteriota bacterium]